MKQNQRYTAKSEDEEVSERFVKSIESSVKKLYQKFHYNKKEKRTEKDKNYKNATHSHICKEELKMIRY